MVELNDYTAAPSWVKENHIPWRRHLGTSYGVNGQYQIGYLIKVHIRAIEVLNGTQWLIWEPNQHRPAQMTLWGEWSSRELGQYHVAIVCDKDGPELPHISHLQGCFNIAQETRLETYKGYREIRAALTQVCSKINLGNIYTCYSSWPSQIQRAVPKILVPYLNARNAVPPVPPDRIEVFQGGEVWGLDRLKQKSSREQVLRAMGLNPL